MHPVKTKFRMVVFGIAALGPCAVLSCDAAELNIMPWPSQVTQQEGSLALDHLPRIELNGRTAKSVRNMLQRNCLRVREILYRNLRHRRPLPLSLRR
jgi:hypothetical protein